MLSANNSDQQQPKDRIGQLFLQCFKEKCVTIIGGGQMANALVRGFVSAGCLEKSDVYICTKSKQSALGWREQGYANSYWKDIFYENVKQPKGIVLIAVKPQMFADLADEMQRHQWLHIDVVGSPVLFVSIMAGIGLSTFDQQLKYTGPGFTARLLPNVNCAVSSGIVLISANNNDTPPEMVNLLMELGSQVGYCVQINEAQFNAASALSGSAPAYIFTVLEALADGGVLNGLSRDLSNRLAAEMVKGSAQLMLNSPAGVTSPAQLKDKVCSPAGTTIAGLCELERAGVRSAFMEALSASTKRANEMDK